MNSIPSEHPSSSSLTTILSNEWSFALEKEFEKLIVEFDKEDDPDRWFNIAIRLTRWKSMEEIKDHYHKLVDDIAAIESGRVSLPSYTDDYDDSEEEEEEEEEEDGLPLPSSSTPSMPRGGERNKRLKWTQDEHRLFLLGLNKYGKGDWKSISRNFVTTRSPTQVATHAQKYFDRQSKGDNGKRSSIHDITQVTQQEVLHLIHKGQPS